MIDVAVQLQVQDRERRFALDVRFATAAPVVALYGPSGGGKSLTLRAMAGLLRPQAGHVRLHGRTLFDATAGIDLAPEQRRVGFLFQDYALFPHLSVRDNVAFGLTSWRRRLARADAERVDELLALFGLAALAQARPAALSGGQRQRVALARALACEPQVLLLDEPFAALHPQLRRQLRDELGALQARVGIPLVLITHDIEDVLALAHTAYLVDGGRIVREVDMADGSHRDRSHHSAVTHLTGEPPRQHDERERRVMAALWPGSPTA
jgi:molybdate transport system ATP-binding protein